jgi:hypothetical protein
MHECIFTREFVALFPFVVQNTLKIIYGFPANIPVPMNISGWAAHLFPGHHSPDIRRDREYYPQK